MVDFGNIIERHYPEYGWLIIDISHFLLGVLAYRYKIVLVLFVIYQVLDIKPEGDHLLRDFSTFGVGFVSAMIVFK